MIISVNPNPDINEFKKLMSLTDKILNEDALIHPEYYVNRNGILLEDDVFDALQECSKNTPFYNTIEKISGQKFPDILVAKLYGVEVKSTKGNHWTSTGSSILESTRIKSVERIYMTFGKLGGNPIEFLSKPYEECLSGIAVTHMPRYLINMKLDKNETIFDKIGISYDTIRESKDPISPIAEYYSNNLRDGERLWWTGNHYNESVSATIKLWKNLSMEEKRKYTTYACVNFPEIFSGDYDRYSLWLTSQGIVDSHIRDQFSAGGQEVLELSNGTFYKFPAVYRRIKNNINDFILLIGSDDSSLLSSNSNFSKEIFKTRLKKWIDDVSRYSKVDYHISIDALNTLFKEYL